MRKEPKQEPVADAPKQGEAAWKAHKEAVARRNEQAYKLGSQRRQRRDERQAAERRAADLRERADLAKRRV
jgi:hypothetical protein